MATCAGTASTPTKTVRLNADNAAESHPLTSYPFCNIRVPPSCPGDKPVQASDWMQLHGCQLPLHRCPTQTLFIEKIGRICAPSGRRRLPAPYRYRLRILYTTLNTPDSSRATTNETFGVR